MKKHRLKKFLILVSGFWFLVSGSFISSICFAQGLDEKLTLSGYLKNEISVNFLDDSNFDLSKFKNIFQLSGEYKFSDVWIFFISSKYWYDAIYDIRDKYDEGQDTMGHIQRADWLRDCYLDFVSYPWFIRLGKQQVAWGQSDGITILDRVNPFDLTEYWLPDFVDLRIPLWMININYSPKLNSNLQLLIIPDFEASTSAPAASPFAFRAIKIGDLAKKAGVVTDSFFPGKQFDNSTFGLQWQDRIGDLEYTLNYLNGFYYSGRSLKITTTYYNREFKRWRVYGGSFNKTFTNPGPLKGITLRGDFAYYNDEPTYYGVDGSQKGYNRWDNVFWLIGLDKYVVTNWLVSFQFSQYIMQDAKPGVSNYVPLNAYSYGPQDQVENIFSLKIATDFMHERLKPEVLWSFTDDNQGRLSPKFTYELKDNLWLTAGIHYFYGKEQDTNGQFRDVNQIYLHLKYTF